METPVLVIFFNRPRVLEQTLEQLKKIGVKQVFFACDGARSSKDTYLIMKCKKLINETVCWKCDINYLYLDENIGCDRMVPKAIDWFFSNVDKGIILEDDCIIDHNFYDFAGTLLSIYEKNESVMNISAPNFQDRKWGEADYYFSRYPSNWGWATWRRAWQKYDHHMKGLDSFLNRADGLSLILDQPDQIKYWKRFFKGLHSGKYTYWDAKWVYSIWKNSGFSITPNANLVCNIGYGFDATHTKSKDDAMSMEIVNINKPLKHLTCNPVVCQEADNYLFKTRYKPKLINRIISFILRLSK